MIGFHALHDLRRYAAAMLGPSHLIYLPHTQVFRRLVFHALFITR